MNERQAAVIAEVQELWADHIGTHYETCYLRHVACFAVLLNDLED